MVRAIFSTVHGKSNFWGKGVRGEGNVHGKSNMRKRGYNITGRDNFVDSLDWNADSLDFENTVGGGGENLEGGG